jgi:hypothetical protein
MRNTALALLLLIAACGQQAQNSADAQTKPAAPDAAQATSAAPASAGPAIDAEKAAILAALQLHADGRGLVVNECNDPVTPGFVPADVGLGRTILFVMVGGPSLASCYGDGPDLHLMREQGGAWREIYATRGGMLVILPTRHNGANDLAFGGPGMTHATSRWTGSAYAAGPDIDDSAIPASAVMLPQ